MKKLIFILFYICSLNLFADTTSNILNVVTQNTANANITISETSGSSWIWDADNELIRSASINDGETSEFTMQIVVPEDSYFSFDYALNTETDYGWGEIYLDGSTTLFYSSGVTSGKCQRYITSGTHTIKFHYHQTSDSEYDYENVLKVSNFVIANFNSSMQNFCMSVRSDASITFKTPTQTDDFWTWTGTGTKLQSSSIVNDGKTCELDIQLSIPDESYISFDYSSSSLYGFYVYVDGSKKLSKTGNVTNENFRDTLSSGIHTIRLYINHATTTTSYTELVTIFNLCCNTTDKGQGSCGDNLNWRIDKNNVLIISGTGDMTNYQLNFPQAPWKNYSISEIIIEEGVTSVADWTYQMSESLKRITLPGTIVTIPKDAFTDNLNVEELNLSEGLQTINDYAFANFYKVKNIVIPNSVTTIGSMAFAGYQDLTNLTLGSGLTNMDNLSFAYCNNLTTLTCLSATPPVIESEGVTTDYMPFSTCRLIVPKESIDLYKAATFWRLFSNITTNIHKINYIVDGEVYKTVEIEEGSTIIPEPSPTKEGYAFSGWSTIPEKMGTEDITITGSFSPICATPQIAYSNGKLTFSCVTKGVKYHYTIAPSTLSSEAETEDGEITFTPDYTVSVYATADGYKESETVTLTISSCAETSVGDINGDGSLDVTDITYLVNKVLGRKVSLVGDSGFDAYMCQLLGVEELTKEALATITTMPTISHQGDEGFTTIDLTYFTNLTNIGGSCINYNDKLSKIVLPPNLQYIGEYGIINNGNVHTLEFPASLNYIGYKALWNSWDNYATATTLSELEGWHSLVFDGETPPTLQLGTNADYNPIGPVCDEDKLNGVYNLGFRIYVPDDAVESYKTAEGWTYWTKFIVGKSTMK